ncbi:hypothetical protein EPYR_00360 [Erwinia pyrifoliae DSM 12163]|nr:hypothetical protein EPYR_00360 [Erwinia pyrifoliae DSM 12163]
MGYGALA